MHRIYFGIAVCYVFLLLTAGFVAHTRNRRGIPSSNGIGFSIAGLTALEIGTILCWCSIFVLGGGPDGRFMSSSAFLNGGLCLVVTFLAVVFSLRLLSLPLVLASLFMVPAICVFAGQSAKIWVVTMAGFSLPPVCLVVIVFFWIRRELGGIAR